MNTTMTGELIRDFASGLRKLGKLESAIQLLEEVAVEYKKMETIAQEIDATNNQDKRTKMEKMRNNICGNLEIALNQIPMTAGESVLLLGYILEKHKEKLK